MFWVGGVFGQKVLKEGQPSFCFPRVGIKSSHLQFFDNFLPENNPSYSKNTPGIHHHKRTVLYLLSKSCLVD